MAAALRDQFAAIAHTGFNYTAPVVGLRPGTALDPPYDAGAGRPHDRGPRLGAGEPWQPLVLSFRWPSVVYALDILAWDVFFPLAMLLAAPVFAGGGFVGWIRRLMVTSGLLALAGLAGVVTGNMQLRNVGIVGYVGVFVVVAGLLAVLFKRTDPVD
ncbi:MAG: hypothetical protein ABR506_08585 [Candidatus Krumholzibacteriia bacterium]